MFADVGRDIGHALRRARRAPGFAAITTLTLAMAIGANAVVFGVLDALVLRQLPLSRADTLYGIQHGTDASSVESYPEYTDLRNRNQSFEDVAAYSIDEVGLANNGATSRVWAILASGNYFDVLRVRPYLGRFFHESDEHGPGSAPYIVLSYEYWRSHFMADRTIVGHKVTLNKQIFVVMGVAPADFHGTLLFFLPDIWIPMVNAEEIKGMTLLNDRTNQWVFMVLGHLKAGITPEIASQDLNTVGAYLKRTYPRESTQAIYSLARPGLYGDLIARPARSFLGGLSMLAGLVLIAACANLGSLFAARLADRAREISLQLALGSRRMLILRQVVAEALVLSSLGGTLGLAVSMGLLRVLSLWRPVTRFPFYIPVTPSGRIYGLILVLTLFSGILFAAIPMRQLLQASPYDIIKSGSRATASRGVNIREFLVAVQVAACAVLLTYSIVAARGLSQSLHSNFGFDSRNALIVETDLNMGGYFGLAYPSMQRRLVSALQVVPGVRSVGLIGRLPLIGAGWEELPVFDDSTAAPTMNKALAVPVVFSISPEYLHAAGTTLLAGRTFTFQDDDKAPRVVIINRDLCRRAFGSVERAIGKKFKLRDGSRMEVIGVVQDGLYKNLGEEPQAAMFFPILQVPSRTNLVIRCSDSAQNVSMTIREAIRHLDPALPVYIETWNKRLDLPLFPSRIASHALTILGVVGALLSFTGIFGVAAYSVSHRFKEFGIRMALGAPPRQIVMTAVGRVLRLLTFSAVTGLVIGIAATRVLSAIVYRADTHDPIVFIGVIFSMSVIGLCATWLPARRALTADPSTLLREQ